jgi:hypothetical protein
MIIKTILYITFILGMVFGYSPTSAAFDLFDASYFGTGAICDDGTTSCDLTARVGRPVPLENRPLPLISLPPPTDGTWNVVNMVAPDDCEGAGRAALQGLINAHSVSAVQPPTLVVLPPCEIWVVPTGNSATGFQIPDDIQDYFHITGHAGGNSAIIMKIQEDPQTPGVPALIPPRPPFRGYDYKMFALGAAFHNQNAYTPMREELPMWAWTGGFALGESVVTAAPISTGFLSYRTVVTCPGGVCEHVAGGEPSLPVANLYEGDLIRLNVESWNNRPTTDYSNSSKTYHRVICSVWTDGTVHPAGHPICAPGGTPLAVGSIKLTGDLQFDMLGTNHYNGPFTGHTIEHLERKGGGTLTSFYPEYFGMSNFRISTDNVGAAQRGYSQGIQNFWCTDCWITDMEFDQAWGNQWYSHGSDAGRTLVSGNDFDGTQVQPMYARCRFDITSVSSNNASIPGGVRITGNTVGAEGCPSSADWDNISPYAWFHNAIGSPILRNKRFLYNCISGCDITSGTTVETILDLTVDTHTNTELAFAHLDPSWAADPTADWGMLINGYNIATLFVVGSGLQIINNFFHNMRVGVIAQAAASEVVYAYNSFMVDDDYQCSRSFFNHGSQKGPSLWEGNNSNCGAAMVATSPQGLGINNQTLMNNRLLAQGRTRTGGVEDQCGGNAALVAGDGFGAGVAGFCNEAYPQTQNPNGTGEFFSSEDNNYIGNILEGMSNPVAFGSCDADDDAGSCDFDAAGNAVYQLLRPAFHKNVWIENMGSQDLETKARNPTMVYPDFEDTVNPNHGVNLAPADWATPARPYPTSLLYDTVGAQPAWWCDESGVFPNIGALYDDYTPGANVLSLLPADRRRLNLPCSVGGIVNQSVTLSTSSETNIVGPNGLIFIYWNSTGVERCWSADTEETQFFTARDGIQGTTWLWAPGTAGATVTYTIECDDGTGARTADVTDSITITVVSAPVANLSTNGESVQIGQGVVLTWEGSAGSSSCQGVSQWTEALCVEGDPILGIGPYCSIAVPTDGSLTGSVVVYPVVNTTYQFQCYSSAGVSSYDNAYVTIYPVSVTGPQLTLNIASTTIADGGTSVLTWSSTGPTSSCVATNFTIPESDNVPSGTELPGATLGSRELSGSHILSPSVDTTYTITCTSISGMIASRSETITVTDAPTSTLTISESTLVIGASANLSWTSTNATVCHGDNTFSGFGYTHFNTGDATSGSITVAPTEAGTYTYLLNCVGAGAAGANSTVVLTVGADPTPTFFTADPPAVDSGDFITLSWGPSTADICVGLFGPGTDINWTAAPKSTLGDSVFIAPPSSGTYVIECTNAGGVTANISVNVTVNTNDGTTPGSPQPQHPWYTGNRAPANNFDFIDTYEVLPQPNHPRLNFSYLNGWQNTNGNIQMLQVVQGVNTLVTCVIGSSLNGCATAPMDISYLTGDTPGRISIDSDRNDADFGSVSGAEVRLYGCADENCLPGSAIEIHSSGVAAFLPADSNGVDILNIGALGFDYIYLDLTIAPTLDGATTKVTVFGP